METHGKILAAWAATLTWQDLPETLREKALDHVVDTIGVMYSGIEVEACAGARRAAGAWGNAAEATVLGTRSLLPAPSAAFLNALHGRIHTYDDTYEPGTLHTGSSVIAAALALAEKHAIDGRTFLAAVIAGYEVATRVAAAVSPGHYASGFHNTGTCTVFGAAAAAARVLKLDALALAEAFGLAGATAGGLRQHQIDGSMLDSAFHGARAAQSGIMVAQLRAAGVQGPPAILEGPLGFCSVMAPGGDVSRLTQGLGTEYEFAKVTIKPYPTCRFTHGPTEAAIELKRKHQIDPGSIREVTVATFRQSIEVSSRPEITAPFDAVVSHQYSIALALIKEKIELAAITAGAGGDPQVLALMRKVRVVHDDALEQDFPRCWPHRVSIAMNDGQNFSLLSEYPPGRVAPIPRATVDAKFLGQSSEYLGGKGAQQALEQLRGIERLDNIRTLTAMLAG
ncbi:MAG: MmgE/PrpD family protein [Betaproteobacteria bacterium]|nr:MmgE/PrpD family protein [Betaproteobacteria bacterium]